MNMTNKEKSKELGQKYFPNEHNIWARENIEAIKTEYACIEMANFVIENTIAWMKSHAYDYSFMGDTCIEDYKKAMEE